MDREKSELHPDFTDPISHTLEKGIEIASYILTNCQRLSLITYRMLGLKYCTKEAVGAVLQLLIQIK